MIDSLIAVFRALPLKVQRLVWWSLTAFSGAAVFVIGGLNEALLVCFFSICCFVLANEKERNGKFLLSLAHSPGKRDGIFLALTVTAIVPPLVFVSDLYLTICWFVLVFLLYFILDVSVELIIRAMWRRRRDR